MSKSIETFYLTSMIYLHREKIIELLFSFHPLRHGKNNLDVIMGDSIMSVESADKCYQLQSLMAPQRKSINLQAAL